MTHHPYEDLMNLIGSVPRWSNCDLKDRATRFEELFLESGKPSTISTSLARLSRVQNREEVGLKSVHLCLLASSYAGELSPERTRELVEKHSAGTAPLNKLCVRDGLGLRVLDMAVDMPDQPGTPDRVSKPETMMANIAFGMEATASGGDLIGLAALAPGSRKSALAILCALHGENPQGEMASFLGSEEAAAVARLIELAPAGEPGPLDWLALAGGREIAALLGAILAGSSQCVPLMLEGWAALSAATVLYMLAPDNNKQDLLGHIVVASSGCPLETSFWSAIGLEPVIRDSGELPVGAGMALCVGLIKQANTICI